MLFSFVLWWQIHVSFTIKPGETIALVGPTGAGKTTIFNLLTGVYKPTDGTFLLDGEELHIDTTWGDSGKTIRYDYFAMTPGQSWVYHPW